MEITQNMIDLYELTKAGKILEKYGLLDQKLKDKIDAEKEKKK